MAFTASTTISRIITLSVPTTTKPTLSLLRPSSTSFFRSSSFTTSLSLPTFTRHVTPTPLRFSTIKSSSSSPISVGSTLPDTTLSFLDPTNEVQTISTSSLTANKTAIIFAVPGAFTPTCSQKHVPSFIQHSAELKSKGVDVIACVSVNDAFVMKAWKENLGVSDDGDVLFLSDGNGDFTRAIGAELDLSDKPVGLGVRSRRYAMLVKDGVVKVLNMEEGGAFTFSGAEDMLKAL